MLIVSYDISNDKVRTKFSKFLKKYGRRLQYSVFEIKNSQRILDLILVEVEKIFAKSFQNTDSILIFGMCEGCKKKVIRYGYAVNEESDLLFM
ncbi:CRISPR-associated endonuclease Cas2 [Candidatus Vampirococcus lugosii]|uniref:CRISPR-associated endoribonuclease Cas2 n=1 Tax=Candidatus Vampirococcus lugosii TaxID=2789015 RepID=A0ABS5QLM0_9BACT|nr:CRISPR-associated protein Cas2 [Candidatus Vampirococcus lugosii]